MEKKTIMWIVVSFAIAGLAMYSNVLTGEFVFDDFEYIVDNPQVRDFTHLSMSDPRQVGYFSFAVNYALSGEDPTLYHVANVAIHIINALLVFYLVRAFLLIATGAEILERKHFAAALLSAALFLAHPAQTQAVSYVTQRFTSLATLLYLLAIVLYMRFRRGQERGHGHGYALYAASLAATFLAMRTKEISFTIPFMIASLEAVLLKESVFGKRRYIYLIPFIAFLAIIPLSILGPNLGIMGPGEGVAETTRVEKLFDLQQRSSYEYFLTQTRVIVFYIKVLLFPVGQSVVHDIQASRSFFEFTVILSVLLLGLVIAGGWYAWRHASRSKSAAEGREKLLAAGIFWFFLTISVESSFIPIKDLIFEHRMYLPSAGFFAALAVIVLAGIDRIAPQVAEERRVWIACVVCLPLALTTYARNDVWTSERNLWDDVVRKNPNKAIGYNNRGTAYAKERQYELALQDLDKAISFFPQTFTVMPGWEDADLVPPNMSKTYLARGRLHLALGNTQKAEEDFERARRIFMPPFNVEESLQLGDLYYKRGAYGHAIEEFTKVLDVYPENIDALNNRGNAYSFSKRYGEAVRDFDQVIGLNPDFALAYHNRGIALAWRGRKELAIKDFRKACDMGFKPACESIEIVKKGGK